MSVELAIAIIAIIVLAMKGGEWTAQAPPWVENLDAELDGLPLPHPMCRCALPQRWAMCRGGMADGHEFVDDGRPRHQVNIPTIFNPVAYSPTASIGAVECVYWRADIAGCEPLTHRNGQRLYYHESMVKEGTCLDD